MNTPTPIMLACAIQDRLTAGELRVFLLIAEGMTTKDVATVLKLSTKTVEAHKYNFMKKLWLHSISQVIHLGLAAEMISPIVNAATVMALPLPTPQIASKEQGEGK